MIDYATIAIAVGAVGAMGVLSQWNTTRTVAVAIKKEQKIEVLAQLIKQLGIKDFKLKDLNAENLDDVGFGRLIVMMRNLYDAQRGPVQDETIAILKSLREFSAPPQPQPAFPPGTIFQPPGQPTTP